MANVLRGMAKVGRPFQSELAQLPTTLSWAMMHDVSELAMIVRQFAVGPLLVVGSGGSMTAAHVIARLHQTHSRQPARAITPYEFSLLPPDDWSGVLLLSASGSNLDVLQAAQVALRAEYRSVSAIIGRSKSKLARRLSTSRHSAYFEFRPPARKDGFLATNSLLATIVLAARAFAGALRIDGSLAATKRQPLLDDQWVSSRPSLTVLAAGWAWPAAVDLESKFAELGLSAVTHTDYRNFAHGRHYGLSARQDRVGVIALSTPDCAQVAKRTLATIPASVPRLHVHTRGAGVTGTVDLLIQVLHLVGRVGSAQGVDPGRPRVPPFGRRLYRMGFGRVGQAGPRGTRQQTIDRWIERKVSRAVWAEAAGADKAKWRAAYEGWAQLQSPVSFAGIVFDYDGTICEANERFGPPSSAVSAAIEKLLRIGLLIGFATGRGDSVLDALRNAIPRRYWTRVTVGMYNGGMVQPLAVSVARNVNEVNDAVRAAHRIISRSPVLSSLVRVRERPTQLSLLPAQAVACAVLRRMVVETLSADDAVISRLQVHESGHSVDVTPKGISKRSVVEAVEKAARLTSSAEAVLTIGDQGRLHGNDFGFLDRSHSLSVDQVPVSLDRCWNVAAVGSRGTSALLQYIGAMHPARNDGVRLAVRQLEKGR